MKFNKKITVTAAVLGAITIAIGAFGAHGLKQVVDAKAIATFETGVRYQMYHVFALLIIGFATQISLTTQKWVFRFFLVGILFFSGSIYLLSLNELFAFDAKSIGFITPLGGLFFIMGWLRLAYGIIVNK